MIQNVIFDMDGTLADTAKATTKAFQVYTSQFDLPQLSEEAIKRAIGYASPEFYLRLFPGQAEEKLLKFGDCVERYEKIVISELADAILFEDVKTLLAALKERGCRLYVASTGSSAHVSAVLESSGILRLFEQVHCDETEKVSMVQQIMGRTSAEEWIMVGDKQKDADAARANHILSVGAGYGYCTPDEYSLFDTVIQKPEDLLEVVKRRR